MPIYERIVTAKNSRPACPRCGSDHSTIQFSTFAADAPAKSSPTKQTRRSRAPSKSGYQVTVPLLPGVITYGRTEEEALEMARDAIRCHLDGLRKSGEEIPDERSTHTAKLRVALSV